MHCEMMLTFTVHGQLATVTWIFRPSWIIIHHILMQLAQQKCAFMEWSTCNNMFCWLVSVVSDDERWQMSSAGLEESRHVVAKLWIKWHELYTDTCVVVQLSHQAASSHQSEVFVELILKLTMVQPWVNFNWGWCNQPLAFRVPYQQCLAASAWRCIYAVFTALKTHLAAKIPTYCPLKS